MITSKLEHDMAGSAGDQTDVYINNLIIHMEIVNIPYAVNIVLDYLILINIILSEEVGCYGYNSITIVQ